MRKCLPILLVIAIMFLLLQVVVNIFIDEKDANYILKTDDNEYMINEHLSVVDDESYYDITVSDKDKKFYTFSLSENFNKQVEIIRDVKELSSGDLTCIFPIYRKNKFADVSCLYKGEQVSYSYLRQMNNPDITNIINELSNMGYKNSLWDGGSSVTTKLGSDYKSIDVYQDNILKGYTFLIWRYRGLYLLKSKESVVKDYLEHDQYNNSLSALVGKYYVSADPLREYTGISELSYYNTKDLGRGVILLPDATSTDYYFNGVYHKKLYMTDVGNGVQYSVDPAREKVEVVGSKDSEFINVIGNKIVKVKPIDFLGKRVYFSEGVDNEKIRAKYGSDVVMTKQREFYYFRTADGRVYRAHEDNVSSASLLFKLDNLTEWKVKNGDILVVAGDKLYFYTDKTGLLVLAVNSELKYNHNNICDFWKE